MSSDAVWVVIPAAGVGKRMLATRPKQYLPLLGKTVLEHTLACFLEHPLISGIVVVISPDDDYWLKLAKQYAQARIPVLHTVTAGRERADSVLSGLDYLHAAVEPTTTVLVHDAARPCLSRADLDTLLSVRVETRSTGALLAMPVRDTMKRAQPGSLRVAHTESRDDLWHALTPQMVPLALLRTTLRAALRSGVRVTDEASALEQAGLQPHLVEGGASNIKITHPADLGLAAYFLKTQNGA